MSDVRGDIGSVHELIAGNIQNVKSGKTTPVCENSWDIVGFETAPFAPRRRMAWTGPS